MKTIKDIYNKDWIVLGLLVFISTLIYFPLRHSGIIMDYLGWLERYKAGEFSDIIHCFNYPGLHQVFHFVNYSIYRLVGANHFGQYFIFAVSHGIVSFTLFKLLKELLGTHKVKNSKWILLITMVVFVTSPYQIQTVTWKACYHYLMVSGFIYGSFYFLVSYLNNRKTNDLIWHHVLFLLALFTLEIALAAPFIYIVYVIFFISDKNIKNGKTILLKTGLVQIVFLLLYFSLNKVLLGSVVGHYGAETHLALDSEKIFGTGLKYFFKRIFYFHFLPLKYKKFIYTALSNPLVYYSITTILLGVFSWFVIKFRSLKPKIKLAGLNVLYFFMAIFPIVTLHFNYFFLYENDRYGYLGSGFLYFAIILLFFYLKRWLRGILIVLFLAINTTLFIYMSIKINEGSRVFTSLVEDFRWFDKEEVVVLSLPINYHGQFMFVDYSENANELKESIFWHTGKTMENKMFGISQFNMAKRTDAIGVNVLSPTKLKVMIAQDGTWFWRKGVGLINYEDDEFKVEKHGWYFTIEIKKPNPNRVYIYTSGDKWKEVEFD